VFPHTASVFPHTASVFPHTAPLVICLSTRTLLYTSERTNSINPVAIYMDSEQWIAIFLVAIMVLSMVAYSALLF